MKKIFIIIVVLIVIAAILAGGAYVWYNKQINTQTSDSSSIVEVEIEQGEAVKDIAVKLQTAGVIKSSDVFYFYIKINQLAPKIQAGKFKIPQNLTVIEVAEFIQRAAGNDVWITIQEGLRYDEIAEILDEYFLKEDNTKFDKETFLDICRNPDDYDLDVEILDYKSEGKSIEGFLFPDTYNVKKDITAEELVKFLLITFENKIKSEKINLESHKNLSAYEVIILASIIEREARTSEERYMISDILQRRLNGDMDGVRLLQADATLLYELKDWEAVVTKELKEKESPYNTYKNVGLIPTPICNPRLDSIKAVLNPKANDYFYYLHDEEGNVHYAKTLEEQTNNQRCYINKNQDYCL
ncbi:endolytic transglycosylase MltG [Candidatus Dojkabacteria bacterium]|nr:endolytic transglycosylase MltG [Candidatus Dojkabacteria bacterium]